MIIIIPKETILALTGFSTYTFNLYVVDEVLKNYSEGNLRW